MKHHKFGTKSSNKLITVHPELQQVAKIALARSPYDFSIIHGWRGEDVQNALFDSGASMKPWPESKHNVIVETGDAYDHSEPCSEAIDFGPFIPGIGIPWNDTHIFAVIAGCLFAAASERGVIIRWGGDWDSDGSTKDQTLMDYGHVEIIL